MANGDKPGNDDGGDATRADHDALRLDELREALRQTEAQLRATRDAYADLYDHGSVGYLTLDPLGTIQRVSPRAAEMLGPSARPLSGLTLVAFVVPEDRGALLSARERAVRANAGAWTCDVRLRALSGDVRWVWLESLLGTAANGDTIWRTAIIDLQDRRAAEAALATQELEQRAHFEGSREAKFLLAPPTFHVARANDSARKLLGASREDAFLGRPLWETAPLLQADGQASDALMKAHIEAAMKDGPRSFEWTHLHADGHPVATSVVLARTVVERETKIDVTMRDESATRGVRARNAQAERLATIGLLAASVAHEINNPLTYVLSHVDELATLLPKLATAAARGGEALDSCGGRPLYTKLAGADAELLDEERVQELARYAGEALEGTTRVVDIVKALGAFARPHGVTQDGVDVNRAVDAAARMARSEMKHRATLERHFAPLPTICANEGKLAQLFLNLFVNAAHAIAEGNAQNNAIEVRTHATADDVFVAIRDTGRGIPKEHLARVFEPFFTTKPTGPGSGAGLGLAICANVVAELGGALTVESEEGKGSCFTVRLPIARQGAVSVDTPAASLAPAPAPAPTAASTPASTEGSTPPTPALARGRVLVIDDEPMILTTIVRILRREHDVVAVGSGAEAQALLTDDQAFDAVLCDLMMPEMTGMDLHGWVASACASVALRMVFMTGGAFTPECADFIASSPIRMIDKPLDVVALRRVVRELVSQHRAPGLAGVSAR